MAVGNDDSVEVCTKHVGHAAIDHKGSRLIFVDTPGFDSPYKPDAHVLQEILDWLKRSFPSGKCRGGVIYLHDISADTYQGIAEHELKALDRSLGSSLYKQLIIATTKWKFSGDRGEHRHQELTKRWRRILTAGSQVRAFRTKEDAWAIVNDFLPALENGQELDIEKGLAHLQQHQNHHHPLQETENHSKVLDRLFGILGLFKSSRVRK
ncbi:hypothetical protein H1R20_g13009, partial [Candolleomyces eurysporus]